MIFKEFFIVPKWQSSIGRCQETSNHPCGDLSIFGYKLKTKQKIISHIFVSLVTQ